MNLYQLLVRENALKIAIEDHRVALIHSTASPETEEVE